jgi:hypothetical protein
MTDDPPFLPPVMYHGPLPSHPLALTDSLLPPSISTLAPQIISSTNRLFFIAHKIGAANCSKWHLVQVAFHDSISLYPSALQDGRFLVKFYVVHPSDVWYNATNQQYWLQYSERNGISNRQLDAHLITPSHTLEDHATQHSLHPVHCWVNLTHGGTYIHSLFEFATIRCRKTCNHADQQSWDGLCQVGGPTNGLVMGHMVRGGTSVVIATRANLTTKCGIIPVPAPFLVMIGLVALNSGVLHLAFTRAARGCA